MDKIIRFLKMWDVSTWCVIINFKVFSIPKYCVNKQRFKLEINIIFCFIIFRANNDPTSKGTDDEPFSWEAREFLRKKLVGKKVFFKTAGQVSGGGKTTRYYGDIFYPTLGENIYF